MVLSQIQCVRLYPLAIPLKRAFSHAAAERRTADPLVVAVELRNGLVGYGETLARPYVTGETSASVIEAIHTRLMPGMERWCPDSFAAAIELIDSLPQRATDGRLILAARAGLELALLDAYSRHFRRSLSEAAGWLGLPGFGPPGSVGRVRYSGVLSAEAPTALRGSVRKMRWFGLRDFKLKVGFDDDDERVRAVTDALGSSLGRRTTLRLDANGGWTVEAAAARLKAWSSLPIACIEQPLPRGQEQRIPELRRVTTIPIMQDESLLTFEDAERLIAEGLMDAMNIRISKNGGLLPAMRLAGLARQRRLTFQLGCLVGETSILSAAGRRFLEYVPGATFAEGSYGKFLLRGDVVRRSQRFGYGGRVRPLPGHGWGVEVLPDLLRSYSAGDVIELRL
ncbi:MAG: mandelate racemase/muconate lactonizing enzyme family protein [Phycisphaerae bacterium]